jgi:hypothetical protein
MLKKRNLGARQGRIFFCIVGAKASFTGCSRPKGDLEERDYLTIFVLLLETRD